MTRTLRWGLLLGLFGCELVVDFDRSRIPEAGVDAGTMDAGATDAGRDTGSEDSGSDDDAGMDDAGMDDAGMDDAGDMDAGGTDAGMDDAGPTDAGTDAGPECTMASECDDSIACTTNACTADRCVYTPVDAACNDTDACTADSCSATTGCENDPICGVTAPATLVLDDLTTILVVPSVEAAVAGHVVIYTDDGGMPSATAIGSATVSAGANSDVTVELTRPAVDGETLHARLHLDDGDGTFEGAATDAPATLGGMPVVSAFEVDIPTGTPDLEMRINGAPGFTDYLFGAGRPTTFAASLPTGNDPTLTLVRGFRYRVVNNVRSDHPFELVTAGATPPPPEDARLLSQAIAGTLEADASIAWTEDGNDVLFTVSAALEVADAYRCSVHPAQMRGALAYTD